MSVFGEGNSDWRLFYARYYLYHVDEQEKVSIFFKIAPDHLRWMEFKEVEATHAPAEVSSLTPPVDVL